MEKHKTCSFIGHRKVDLTDTIKQRVMDCVESLIIDFGVTRFLFGSRSEFNSLCHSVVTSLQEKYASIRRIAYTCRNEICVLEIEREKIERTFSLLSKKECSFLGFEEECEYKTKYASGKASYVERNQAMIDESEYCIFYYDEKYLPPPQKHSQKNSGYYQPKSGTALAYEYAKKKGKTLINIFY